jgi:osmotically-inducible protein OsmY
MNRKALYRLAFAAAAAALFVTSAPARASESDDRIVSSFEESYVNRTYLKDDSIKAESKGGIVRLTGTVAEESHKNLAQETAANMAGVTRVENELVTKAEAAAADADTWIGRKVYGALLFHRNVDAGNTDIAVKDGIVTLKGEAINQAQMDLTAEYAKDIEGVKEVKNEMTIARTPAAPSRTAGEKMDDASITAQVKGALSAHHSTSAIETGIQTLDGAVTVTGIAKNPAEKSLVSKLVADIKGVTSVKNEMTIEVAKAK